MIVRCIVTALISSNEELGCDKFCRQIFPQFWTGFAKLAHTRLLSKRSTSESNLIVCLFFLTHHYWNIERSTDFKYDYAHKTHYLTEIPEINNYNSIYYNFNLRVKTKSKSDFKGNVMGCSDQIQSPEPNFTRRIKLNLLG